MRELYAGFVVKRFFFIPLAMFMVLWGQFLFSSHGIPLIKNNFIFERVKAPNLDDRKWYCIDNTQPLAIVQIWRFDALKYEVLFYKWYNCVA